MILSRIKDGSAESFYTAVDTDILSQLSQQFFEKFNQAPAHPKYGVLQNKCVPEDLFDKDHQIENDKNLIFVRRIPSVREITQRINAAYDEIFAMQILDALVPTNKTKLFKQWKNKKWSRDFFKKKISNKSNTEDNFEEINESQSLDDESPIKSHILDLFIIKKNDKVKTTDCSNFRNRLVIPSSLFSILLEPSSDYKTGDYLSFYTHEDSQKKADYLSAIRDYRKNHKVLSENIVNFEIGFEYSEHHTLIGGRSGSGKSNLVNVIIQNIAYMYSPDEVELFLLDYKDGVEFNSYTQPYLTHASLIAVNSNVSYGVSFLKYIIEEKNRRSELFKQAKCKDFKEYREKTKNKLSRIVIVIDEFQTLFTTKDKMQVEQIFAEILRKGRSFGIHLILSTQTLSGVDVGSMSQLKSQIGNRIALAMGHEESMAFLSMNNEAAVKLKGKPEAIYNNRAGNSDGNKKVFVPFASREKMEILLEKIEQKHSKTNPKIYDGDMLPKIPNEKDFSNNTLSLLLGKEQNFKENDFKINFSKIVY